LEIAKWTLYVPYPYQLTDAQEFIKKCITTRKTSPTFCIDFGITIKDKVIGVIGVVNIDKFYNKAEIGY